MTGHLINTYALNPQAIEALELRRKQEAERLLARIAEQEKQAEESRKANEAAKAALQTKLAQERAKIDARWQAEQDALIAGSLEAAKRAYRIQTGNANIPASIEADIRTEVLAQLEAERYAEQKALFRASRPIQF